MTIFVELSNKLVELSNKKRIITKRMIKSHNNKIKKFGVLLSEDTINLYNTIITLLNNMVIDKSQKLIIKDILDLKIKILSSNEIQSSNIKIHIHLKTEFKIYLEFLYEIAICFDNKLSTTPPSSPPPLPIPSPILIKSKSFPPPQPLPILLHQY